MRVSSLATIRPLSHFGALVALSLAALAGTAQAAPVDGINTDRPEFVQSAEVVGKDRFQIETSFAVARDSSGSMNERLSSTPTLLRFGLTDAVELRLSTDGRMRYRNSDDATGIHIKARGFADLAVGAKWHFRDAKGDRPSLALLANVEVDSGSHAFRGQKMRPSLAVAADWKLANNVSIGIMPGMKYDRTENGNDFVSGMFGVSANKAWNNKLRTFVEVAMPQIASDQHGGTQTTYNVGAAYLLAKNTQLDVVYQHGASRNTADHTLGLGVSTKF